MHLRAVEEAREAARDDGRRRLRAPRQDRRCSRPAARSSRSSCVRDRRPGRAHRRRRRSGRAGRPGSARRRPLRIVSTISRTFTNCPGQSRRSLLAKVALSSHRAGRAGRSDCRSPQASPVSITVALSGPSALHIRGAFRPAPSARAGSACCGHGEDDVDRLQLRDDRRCRSDRRRAEYCRRRRA